jgi:hypothetical protein
MAHFYGRIRGSRGEATRAGTRKSGYMATVASWQGAVVTRLWHDEGTGLDMAVVELTDWRGAGVNRVLYEGPVGGKQDNS